MKTKNKLLLIVLLGLVLVIAAICGAMLYYYFHPSSVKALIEKSISRSTGTSLKIESLSYSIKPLRILAKGIRFNPGEDLKGFYLEIPELVADMSLEGSLGHKRLIFQNLKMDGFSFRVSHDLLLPRIDQKSGGPSFLGRIVKRLIALFLFRDIRFQAAQIVNGNIAAQIKDQTVHINGIHAHLNTDHLVEIACQMNFQWPSRKIRVMAPHVVITTDHAISFVDPKISCLLKSTKGVFQSPGVSTDNVSVTAGLIYDHNIKKVFLESLNLVLEGAVFKQNPETSSDPLTLNLKAQGFLDLNNERLSASYFHLGVHEIWELKGRLNARFGSETRVGIELLDGHGLPQKILPFVPNELRLKLAPLTISGSVTFRGKIDIIKANGQWDWAYDIHGGLKENRFSYAAGEMKVSGSVTGDIRAKGEHHGIGLSVRVKGDKISLSGKDVALKPFTVGLSISGEYPVFEIEELKANIPQARADLGEKTILVDDISVNIQKGTFDGEKRSLHLPKIRLNSSLLKNLVLSLTVDGKQIHMVLHGKQTNALESALGLGLLPSGWQYDGVDSIYLKATRKEKAPWSFSSELAFQELIFENRDASCMAEKVSVKVRADGQIDLKDAYVTGRISSQADRGEILYDRFYFDLNSQPFFSSCEIKYEIQKRSLRLSGVKLGLKDILTLNVHGTLNRKSRDQRLALAVRIPKTALKPVFGHFILEPFQTESPFLTTLNIGGVISADMELAGNGTDWTVTGHCMWHNGTFFSKEGKFSFKGIDLDLPVWYEPKKAGRVKKTEKGALLIQSMNLPMLPEQRLALTLDAGPNALSVKAPTTLKIPGGKVNLGPIVSKDIFGSRRTIDTRLKLKDVDIQPLLSRVLPQPVKGRLSGKLDPIRFEGGTLSAYGRIKAEVFNGEVIISDLGASEMFSSTPVYRLSTQLNTLRLLEMTAGTSFGKIEGVLNGHIKNLEIAYGQPQKFDLLLETVNTKGVPQRISVKALDNIARIGGGQSPFVGLAGSFAMLFKEFPYKKIGLRASLENDVFRVNGTIKEDGNEFLVKRGGFSGVNVVNQNPDNRISFKDMVKRIKRVTAKGSGPVIK